MRDRIYDTNKIIKLRKQGLSCEQIKQALGLKSRSNVAKICRENSLGGSVVQTALSLDTVRENARSVGFEYIGGYKNYHSTITVKCLKCGALRTISYHSISEYKNGTYNANKLGCRECEKARHEGVAHEEERLKAEAREKKRLNRLIKQTEAFDKKYNEIQAVRKCKQCLQEYSIAETHYRSRSFCSDKCARRWNNRTKLDKRIKLLKIGNVDKDITLERLYENQRGICYICGKACDWDDRVRAKGGTIVAGNFYPSIDHIVPLNKGGAHTWDNVKLAHRICNSLKSDK